MPTDRKFAVGLRAKTLRKEVLHVLRLHSQYCRLDNADLRQLGDHAGALDRNHGHGPRLHRRPSVLLHRGDLRVETPGRDVLFGQHGLSVGHDVQLLVGFRLPLADRGHAKPDLSGPVPIPVDVGEFRLYTQFLSNSVMYW